MHFFIISDLHLGNTVDKDASAKLIKAICKKIREEIDRDETVLFVVLGDIADRGNVLSYENAKQSLDLINNELSDYSVKFEFVPGNHDLVDESLISFDEFTSLYGNLHSFEDNPVYSRIYENTNFIFADSTLTKDFRAPGKVNLEEIRANVNPKLTNILFFHHALSHGRGSDHDVVQDSAAILAQLNDMHINFLFHGHTHRADITVPKDTLIEIGCGSISGSTDWFKSVFHQFTVGYILDGHIVRVERWLDAEDGQSIFPNEELYPQPRTFADPRDVDKNNYSQVADYIPRCILSYELASEHPLLRAIHKDKQACFCDAIQKHRLILLLCDAGMGKTIEMQNLAYDLHKKYHTFLFLLKDYTGEAISDLIPESYKQLSPNRVVLLFDGYDELTNELRMIFVKKLRRYLRDNCGVRIAIASRRNFCHVVNNQYSLLPEFEVYVLDELNQEDIRAFLEKNLIDVTRFWNCADVRKVGSLLSNPFYLTKLSKIYFVEKDLPDKAELMDKLITDSFEVDDIKYENDFLNEQFASLFSHLEKLAFTMQLMQQTFLDDHMEYQKMFSNEQRELIKRSGIFTRDGDKWTFSHNNFREYLSARFLSNQPKETTVSILSDGVNLKPSWINTLGYLSGMMLPWSLFEWLSKISPTALVKFESDRLDPKLRTGIFKCIFEKYENLRLHFIDELCNEAELACFANNKEVLLYLVDRIVNPCNQISQYTAVNILRHYPRLFGLDDLVRESLIDCLKKFPETSKEICRLALMALCQLKLNTPSLTEHLMEMFGQSEVDFIRLGMYEYLIETNEQDLYINFFLDGIQYILLYLDDTSSRIGNEHFTLIAGLKKMTERESITQAIKFFSVKKNFDFTDRDEVLASIFASAVSLNNSGCADLFDVVLACYVHAFDECDQTLLSETVKFFALTNSLLPTAIRVMTWYENEPHKIGPLVAEDLLLIEQLKEAYVEGSLKSTAFCEVIKWFVRNRIQYDQYAQLIQTTDGIILPDFIPPKEYGLVERKGAQDYFDALFDEHQLHTMFVTLLSKIENPELTTEELFKKRIPIETHSALWRLRSSIYRYGSDIGAKIKVSEFFSKIDMMDFVIESAASYLNDKSGVIPTEHQLACLKLLVGEKLVQNPFEKALVSSVDSVQISRAVCKLLSVILYLDYPLPEPILLKLCEFPEFLWDKKNTRTKYAYLASNLSNEKLRMRLIDNVRSERVINEGILREYFEFFQDKKDDALSKFALNICRSEKEYTSLRSTAWRYLYHVLGVEYIISEVMPYADGLFLIELNGTCKDIPCDTIRTYMEIQYAIFPSQQLQEHLITLGSAKALKDYVAYIKSEKHTPSDDDWGDNSTAAVSEIRDAACLPLLEELLVAILDKDFVDASWYSLRNSLSTALIQCGENACKETIAMLELHRPSAEESESNFRYCNHIIESINNSQKAKLDVPFSFDEAISFLKSLD